MAAKSSQLDIILGGRPDGAINAIHKVDHETTTLFQRIKEKNLEARQSGEVAFERLIKGGGAAGLYVLGFEVLLHSIKSASEAIAEFHEGQISVGEAWIKFGEGIPIIGGVVKTLRETAEAMAQALDPVATKKEAKEWEHLHEEIEKARKEAKEYEKTIKALHDQNITGGMTGAAKTQREAELELAHRLTEAHEKTRNSGGIGGDTAAYTRMEKEAMDAYFIAIEKARLEGNAEKKKDGDAELSASEKHQSQLTHIEEEARVNRLKRLGLDGESRIEEIKKHFQQEREESDRQFKEENKNNTGTMQQRRERAMVRDKAIDSGEQEALGAEQQKQREEGAAKQLDIEQRIREFRLAAMREEAGLGGEREQRELKIAELQEKAAIDQAKYLKLAQDENATIGQRLALLGLAARAQTTAAEQIRRINAPEKSTPTPFGFESAHYLTGVTGKDSKLTDSATKTAEGMQDANKTLALMLTALGDIAKGAGKVARIYSGN